MIECNFCNSKSKANYIYAECNHFICLECASVKWDKKYSFKCCNKITFLEEQTCYTLEMMNRTQVQEIKVEGKENINTPFDKVQTPIIKVTKEERPLKNREVQQSIYLSQFENKPAEKIQPYMERKQENNNLAEMQEIMSQNVYRIKMTFESYRKQLERKEELLLKEVYNKYSEHLAGIKHTVTQQDAQDFRQNLNKIISEEFTKLNTKQPQGKSDKILEKLEYNQLKMKEKLNRHYELLK